MKHNVEGLPEKYANFPKPKQHVLDYNRPVDEEGEENLTEE